MLSSQETIALNGSSNHLTLMAHYLSQQKSYYRIDDSQLSLVERISKLVVVLFKTMVTFVTFGWAFNPSDVQSQFREVLRGKREIIILEILSENSLVSPANLLPSPQALRLSDSQLAIADGNSTPPQHILTPRNPSSSPQTLSLSNSQLATASEDRLLADLQEFCIYKDQLQVIPECLGPLSPLETLNFVTTQLQKMDILPQLLNLQKFYLLKVPLPLISENIGLMSTLQELCIYKSQLEVIPESIGRLSKLELMNLTSNLLQQIPESMGGLSSLKNLKLTDNHLKVIPESIGGLSKLQILELDDNRLETLPESMDQLLNLRILNLKKNAFQTIPDCLYRLSPLCLVNLEENCLTSEAIEDLRARAQASNYKGPRFSISLGEEENSDSERLDSESELQSSGDELQDLETILTKWCDSACKQKLVERLSAEKQNDLSCWLMRLKETSDYEAQKYRLKGQVAHLLAWLAEESNSTHVDLAFLIIEEAVTTCEDRVAQSFNALSIHMKICQCANLSLADLKDMIIGLERYDKLYTIAKQKCLEFPEVDPIEVHLSYEIQLKDKLKLPIETEDMKYFAPVTPEDIKEAKKQIRAETTPDKQIDLLLKHPLWIAALEKSPSFEALERKCQQEKCEALEQLSLDILEIDEKEIKQLHLQFQQNDKTTWNPFYLLTQNIVFKMDSTPNLH